MCFVGLQGSYRRGEATEESDIDLCVILDRLEPKDVELLRQTLDRLPEGHKAAGFVCGAAELRAWPAFEIFAFSQDMDAWYGELAPLLPPVTRADALLGCRTAVAALYHEAAQALLLAPGLSGEAARAAAHSLAKAYLRALQCAIFARKGVFPRERAAALALAEKEEAELLSTARDRELPGLAVALLEWSGARLQELPMQARLARGPQRRKKAGRAK
ncbi:MAG: nucleotidyltransferase domain-containing protein [Desulfovibrio sp.]|nr:nucleotidyltransferase domain-containing protein [Desulfovibrio sp.]